LSRFLHELLHRRKFCNGLKPGLAPLRVIKFYTSGLISGIETSKRRLRCSTGHSSDLYNRTNSFFRLSLYPAYRQAGATLIQRIKFVPGLQKHQPTSRQARHTLLAPGLLLCLPGQFRSRLLRRVTPTNFIAVPSGYIIRLTNIYTLTLVFDCELTQKCYLWR
jgi:hypothetical protein